VDENTVPAENIDVAEDSSVVAPPAPEPNTSDTPDETEVTTPAAAESSVETEDGETERKPSRAERRIRDLTARLREAEQQPNQSMFNQGQAPKPMFESGREYTAEELEQRMVQRANDIASIQTQAQLNQYKAEVNLDRDIEVIPTKYSELDDTSEDFIPELVETIESEYKAKAYHNGTLDSSVRLSDIAERHVRAARAAAKKATARTQKAVAESQDTAAVKPGAETKQEKSIDQMSSTEIEDFMRKQGRYVRA
jgi:hypothetical protein